MACLFSTTGLEQSNFPKLASDARAGKGSPASIRRPAIRTN